jgi:hemerythrin-like domain-containing protein
MPAGSSSSVDQSGGPMFSAKPLSRRSLIAMAGAAGAGLLITGCTGSSKSQVDASTAIEILDRQHGILYRAISILEEIRGGMDARMDLPPEIIQGTVEVVRLFVVEHHQKLEEKYIFPAFDAANKMSGLVGVLREQHAAGSQVTDILKQLSAGFSAKDLEKRRTMGSAIHHFSRMYRAHSNREDTMLFPIIRQVVAPKAYGELNSVFEKADADILGKNGFDELIQKLTNYENILGIGDLAAFTPRMDELS